MLRVLACTQWRQTILDSACGSFVCKKLQLWPAVSAAHTLTHTHRGRRRRKRRRRRRRTLTSTHTHARMHPQEYRTAISTAPTAHTHTHTHSHKVTATATTIHRHGRMHTHTNTPARDHTHARARSRRAAILADRCAPKTQWPLRAKFLHATDRNLVGSLAAGTLVRRGSTICCKHYKDAAATRERCCCHGRRPFRWCVRTSLQL